MLKNKIIFKRIRNICILVMAVAILVGAYTYVRRSRAENVIQIALEVTDKSGNKLFFMSLSKIVLREEEQVLILLGDVTDIVDAQKVALWRDIATRIAHEVKNPLTPIKLMAERVKRRTYKMNDAASRDIISESMDIIITEADNLKELIEEFNTWANFLVSNSSVPNAWMVFMPCSV